MALSAVPYAWDWPDLHITDRTATLPPGPLQSSFAGIPPARSNSALCVPGTSDCIHAVPRLTLPERVQGCFANAGRVIRVFLRSAIPTVLCGAGRSRTCWKALRRTEWWNYVAC